MTAIGPFALVLLAGVISFTSPCCLPLMPGYVSFISGVSEAEGADGVTRVRSRRLLASALFVLGFAAMFTLLGAGAALFGISLLEHRRGFTQIGGAFVVVMGLVTIGVLRVPFLYRERRFDLRRIRPGPLGAAPLGVAFAVGWTPCIGPVLAGILAASAATESASRGAALLFVYSLGLGLPFVLLAFGFAWAGRAFGWFCRHGRAIEIAGGATLVVMGVLMITGAWMRLFTPVLRVFSRVGWPPL